MKIQILFLAALCLSCRGQRLVAAPDPRCNTPCYEGTKSQAGKGVCSFGNLECVDGEVTKCVGSGKPQTVSCNGLDNNCDGKIDDPATTCDNKCGKGKISCLNGMQTACIGNEGSIEKCDNIDNDCDGIVDNVVYASIADAVCYSAGLDTLGKGACKAGTKSCENGRTICSGEVLPKTEMCNHKDDNCNGTVDEGTALYPRDIVICVDNSGSMGGVINQVKNVTQKWALKYNSRVDLQWALLECPGPKSQQDELVQVLANFGTVTQFNQKMAYEYAGDTGSEPTIDAVYLAALPANPLNLNWRAGAKRTMVMFTDEEAQSYLDPVATSSLAGDTAANAQMKTFIFTVNHHATSYHPIHTKTGGKILDITMNAATMEAELDAMIDECP